MTEKRIILLPLLLLLLLSDLLWKSAVGALSVSSKQHQHPQSKRKTAFPNSVPAQPSDVESFIRQTGQIAPAKAAIGVPSSCACRHGFPQAFAMDPIHSGRINSGLLKLTCPLLVRAVDSLEDEGMISLFNQRLEENNNNSNNYIQQATDEAHAVHAASRQELLNGRDVDAVRVKLGERGTTAFLEAGVAGASAGSTDVKCLHAWLADSLFRGETPMGKAVTKELVDRGVDLTGILTCNVACDPRSGTTPEPPVPRNKQRLKTGKTIARRKRRKTEEDLDDTAPSGNE
jgi:hypothetical protein